MLLANSAASAGQPGLAGVMLHPTDPGKSVAIVNGRRLRLGSTLYGFELTEIASGHVTLRDPASGHEVVLSMGTGSGRKPGRTTARQGGDGSLTEALATGRTLAHPVNLAELPEEELLDRVNPWRLVWMAYSALAQASLRQIQTAQDMFAINDLNSDGIDQYADRLSDLARHRLVQADLAGGEKFGYRFLVRSWVDDDGPHYECIAEPVRADTHQPFYYMDESGVIRGQLHARAGFNSPPVR